MQATNGLELAYCVTAPTVLPRESKRTLPSRIGKPNKELVLRLVFAAIALALIEAGRTYADDLRIKVPGKHLLYRKIIVIGENVMRYPGEDEPVEGRSLPVAPFTIYHKLKATRDGEDYLKKGPDFYLRVGESDGRQVGWLKVTKLPPKTEDLKPGRDLDADVIDWDTRFVLAPLPPAPDRTFNVFEDRALKKKTLALDQLSLGHVGMAPILMKYGKDADAVYQVILFAGRAQSSKNVLPIAGEAIQLKDLKLEVVFVISTTASMGPGLQRITELVEKCAQALAGMPKLKGSVRFGVVEYRDLDDSAKHSYSTPEGKFAAHLVSPLTEDLGTLARAVSGLKNEGGGDTPDDVLAGLHMAVTSKEIGWSVNSSKHIILIGNASAHLTGPGNDRKISIQEIIRLAQPQTEPKTIQAVASKTFHAVQILNPQDADDSALCSKQFRQISDNGYDGKGFYLVIDPNNENDTKKGFLKLAAALTEAFGGLSLLRKSDAKGMDESRKPNAFVHSYYSIVRTSITDPFRPHMGYASEFSLSGKQVAQVRVMVTYSELDRLRSTLDFAHSMLAGKTDPAQRRDVSNILRVLKNASVEIAAGQTLEGDEKIQDLITDLPLRPGVLNVSASDVAQMDFAAYRDWLSKLKASQKRAEMLLKNDDWIDVADTSAKDRERPAGVRKQRYLLLLEAELP